MLRRSLDLRQSLDRPDGALIGGLHHLSSSRSRQQNRQVVHARRRLSPTRLPLPANERGFYADPEGFISQDWLDAPMSGSGTEGPTSLSELPPGPRSWADACGGGEWAGFGTGDFYDTTDGSSADEATATANGNSAGSPLPLSDSSLSGSTLSGSWRGSVDPADEPAGAAVTASQELEARGALRSLLRRLTPQWLTPRQRGLALLWMLVGLVATNWVLVKDSGGLEPLTFSFLRFATAAAAFSPFLPEAIKDTSGTLLPAGLELGLWTSAGYLTQAIGLSSTDASRASFISTFTVLAVPFLAGSRLGDQREIKPITWLCSFGAIAGVSLLEQGGSAPPGVGDVWSLLSAIFFGVQIYRTEKLSRKLPPNSTFQLMSISLTTVAVVAFASAVLAHPTQALNLLTDPAGALSAIHGREVPWQTILWTGLASTDLALLIELTALNTVSSIDASLIYSAEPVLGAGLAFLVLGERFSGPSGYIGAAIILASSFVAQISGSGDEASQA